jgi:hypothetical protein
MSDARELRAAPRPRATTALAVVPLTITDRTAPHVLGLEPRAFREFLVERSVPHVRLGRRVVARVDDVLEALGLAAVTTEAGELATVVDDESSADDVLARIGRKRAR